MNPRKLLDPGLIISMLVAGCLVALGAAATVALLGGQPPQTVSIDDIPDRFVQIMVEPDLRVRKEGGRAAGKGASRPESARRESKLLGGLIGTRGAGHPGVTLQSASTAKSEPAPGPETRTWFPTTLLWAPRVVTDATGHAEIEVVAPDQLTEWRVLGLSAAANGSLSGQVTHFNTALDTFVEPVLPDHLRRGDTLEVPVRVGNRTSGVLRSTLRVETVGLTGGLREAVEVPGGGTLTTSVRVSADQPGPVALHTTLVREDAAHHTLNVVPRGERTTSEHRGLLGEAAAPLHLDVPANASHATVIITAIPGPAGLIRAEVARGVGGTIAQHAAAFHLGLHGAVMLETMGQPASPSELESLRTLRLRAQQGLVVVGAQDAVGAELAARAMTGGDTLAQQTATGLRAAVRGAQLADGSWAVAEGSRLQLLVARTAWLAEGASVTGQVRAAALLERHMPRLLGDDRVDPYTPAMATRCLRLGGEREKALRERVAADLRRVEADPRLLDGLLRPDGLPVTLADARIAAALAGVGDAGGRALADWSPTAGFGDGFTTLMALELLAQTTGNASEGQQGEEPAVVMVDGDPPQSFGEAPLEQQLGPGSHTIEVRGAPGRAWHVQLSTWTPWVARPHPTGLGVAVNMEPLEVGQRSTVHLELSGPSNERLWIRQELPAGMHVLKDTLSGGRWLGSGEGWVELESSGAGAVEYSLVPAFAGQLWSGPTHVALVSAREQSAVSPPQQMAVDAVATSRN
jgi:hypothetical protein